MFSYKFVVLKFWYLEGEAILSGDLDESSQDCVTMIYETEDEPMEALRWVFFPISYSYSGFPLFIRFFYW